MKTAQEILRMEREQVRRFNRGQVDAIVKQFDPRFVGFSSTRHERITGLAALHRTFFYYLHKSPKLRYRIAQPRVQQMGDAAVATFYWTVHLGPRHKIDGRGTHVFARRGKVWRIVHEHFSRAH